MNKKTVPSLLRIPFSTGLALAAGVLHGAPAGPAPTVPEGGALPGAFPNTSVTGVNVVAKGSTTFNGSVEVTGLDGNGPIRWSVNRYNRGDFALRLSPGDPVAALGNLNQGFVEFGDSSASVPASQAWRPSRNIGVVIPTARQNGPVDWGDGEGPFFPTVGVSWASSGPSYSMNDGSFGSGDLDINTGRAGTHASSPEANFAFSTAWFPFDQGWLGGDVGAPIVGDPNGVIPDGTGQWSSPEAHATGLTAGLVRWPGFPEGSGIFGGRAELTLPGVNALEDGMIFASSSDGGSDVNVVGVAPKDDGSGWWVTIREDAATDAETLVPEGQSEFQFVYVPFDSERLVGGHIVGSSGAKRKAVGDFAVVRTGTGAYELTIPGKTGADGMLLLQVADLEPGTSVPLASRAFLSYEYTGGKFVIQSRKTTGDTTADLADANFYVAWVDFANPLAPPAGPRLRDQAPVVVNAEGVASRDAGLGIHSTEPEVLVVTIDTANGIGATDPLTQQFATAAVVGRFYDPRTLAPTSEPFAILGNSAGAFSKVDVEFNPVSRQYVVVANARASSPTGNHVPRMALVNPLSVAGTGSPVVRTLAFMPETTSNFDDLAVAVSTANGNILLGAEYSVSGEGEATVGVLFDKDATLLTPEFTRLDRLQSVGDEDDPDVVYLPGRDVFLYVSNTDNSNGSDGVLSNRIVGSVVATVPGPDGKLQTTVEQVLSDGTPVPEGHPASFLNPFNGELLTAYDGGNGTAIGDLSYFNIGAAPTYAFTSIRPEIPYLAGSAGNPFNHQHPQFAADPVSGVIALGHQAFGSTVGLPNAYVFLLLGPDGSPLPSQLGTAWFLADSGAPIGTGPNDHVLGYSPAAGRFLVAYNNGTTTSLASFQVTSSHLAPVAPPSLVLSLAGSTVVLSWPATATSAVLETKSVFGGAWSPVNGTVVEQGGQKTVTLPLGAGPSYFRLKQP